MPALLSEHETWFDEVTGQPLNAGYVYIGARGLSPKDNLITIYADRDLTTPIANPQRTDSSGRTENKIHVPGKYSIEVEDVNNVQKYINLDNGITDSDTVDGFHASATAEAGELIALDSNKHLPADGFKFPSTSVPSADPNVLDDYEEGDWTPVVADATSGGNTGTGTFTGKYVRVGSIITLFCRIVNIDTTGMTGGNNLYIRGLPFSVDSSPSDGTGAVMMNGFTAAASTTFVVARAVAGTSYIDIREMIDGNNALIANVDQFNSGSADIIFSLVYRQAN